MLVKKEMYMSKNNVAPEYRSPSFNCPHCGAFSAMKWSDLLLDPNTYSIVSLSECHACKRSGVWVDEGKRDGDRMVSLGRVLNPKDELVYPHVCLAPLAEPDMPEVIKSDFEEARKVFGASPRASAALLRLCVQKLCHELLGKKGDIHTQIGELVDKGLPPRVLKAFDTIRIFGNESVHPGTINLGDTPDVALSLFGLLNMAVRHCITEERELESIRALTPSSKRRDF